MADSNPETPRRTTRGAAASFFETAAFTPSSVVETPSPASNKKNKRNAKLVVEIKEKEKKKEPENMDIGEITTKDLAEAGMSGGDQTAVAKVGKSREGSRDSDCEFVETATVVSETSTISRTRRGKRRRMEAVRDSEESLTDDEVRQKIREDSLGALTALSASVIASRAFEWLTTIDDLRARSKNLQSAVSGNIKRNLTQVRRAITILLARVHATGDTRHLKQKNEDQALEIIDLKARLENAARNEQYYREQTADLSGSTVSLAKRSDIPNKRAAIRSRQASQLIREDDMEMSSDDVFAVPLVTIDFRELSEDTGHDDPWRRPEGVSPERWRRGLRSEKAETSVGTCKEDNMTELKIFIKQ